MTVNIEKIAKSAGIHLKDIEKEAFQLQVESIIGILQQLAEVDTSNVKPLINIYQGDLILREDIAIDSQSEATVMTSANNARHGYFVTPKFVES